MQEMIPFVGPHTDIMGPDMGTNEQIMAWFMDTYSVYMGYAVNEIVTGKPVAIGGTEGRREATGRGVVYLVERAMNMLKMDPEKCTAIVQGFGNVGSVAALSLAYKSGVKVVGISDHTAAIYNPKGIDVKSAEQHMIKKGNLRAFAQDDHVNPNEFLTLPCDILAPCAVDRVITAKKCRPTQVPHPCRRRERPDHARCGSASRPTLGRSLRDPGHSLQRRRRHRFVLRVGARSAGVSVVGSQK